MSERTINYYRTNQYGRQTLRFAGAQPAARAIQRLTGCTTLRPQDLSAIADLGYVLTEVLPPREA